MSFTLSSESSSHEPLNVGALTVPPPANMYSHLHQELLLNPDPPLSLLVQWAGAMAPGLGVSHALVVQAAVSLYDYIHQVRLCCLSVCVFSVSALLADEHLRCLVVACGCLCPGLTR